MISKIQSAIPVVLLTLLFAIALPLTSSAQNGTTSGVILESMSVAGYTYMKVDDGKAAHWVAVPATRVKVGDTVAYYQGMVKENFSSKPLNRTFETIIFSSGIVSAPQKDAAFTQEQQEAHQGIMMGGQNSTGSSGAIVPFQELSVKKAVGKNSYTVEELFKNGKKLNTQTVRIRGQVVKFSPSIMNRNWIHLQDGTGNPMVNTHDLVITTTEQAKKGDTITVEGIVAADKDFGAGYSYVVLVEQAKILP